MQSLPVVACANCASRLFVSFLIAVPKLPVFTVVNKAVLRFSRNHSKQTDAKAAMRLVASGNTFFLFLFGVILLTAAHIPCRRALQRIRKDLLFGLVGNRVGFFRVF
jgi:uncharacterized membrane protein